MKSDINYTLEYLIGCLICSIMLFLTILLILMFTGFTIYVIIEWFKILI